jgi:hypothetical protein
MQIRHTVSGWRYGVTKADECGRFAGHGTLRYGSPWNLRGVPSGQYDRSRTARGAHRVDRAGGFPRRGTYHGQDGVKPYLTQPRAAGCRWGRGRQRSGLSWLATGSSYLFTPGVRPKGSNHGQDVSLADVYALRNGRVVEMQAFAGRREARRWVGAEAERVR